MPIVAILLQTSLAFNLVCNVNSVSGGDEMSHVEVFRVDLEAKRFCFDDCSQTLPIARVTDTELVLQDEVTEVSDSIIYRRVSREDGGYVSTVETPFLDTMLKSVSSGRCEAAPFTGFPSRKF